MVCEWNARERNQELSTFGETGRRCQIFTFDVSGYERRRIADKPECLGEVWRNWLAYWVVVAGLRVCVLTDVILHPNTALEWAAYARVRSKSLLCQSLSILMICFARASFISRWRGMGWHTPVWGF